MTNMNILQVNSSDLVGGAETISLTLHEGYQKRGYNSWLAVGKKKSTFPDVLPINHQVNHSWEKFWLTIGNSLSSLANQNQMAAKIRHLLVSRIGQPHRWLKEKVLGHENFYFPASTRLLDFPPQKPHILHCHNLHGNYFDLHNLAVFSQQMPLILTLHDAWLLTGHCAHSLGCDRWKTGCGKCPDLTIYPAIERDGTAYNWQKKREIYAQSKLFVVTPSRWLMSQVEQSMLKMAVVKSQVIPNGIDLSIFQPVDKYLAREKLGISKKAKILLFTANFIQNKNPFKDYETIQRAVEQLAANWQGEELILLVLGDSQPQKRIGHAKIQFIPFQKDSSMVASYYQAADIYVHGAKADTFPNTVLEALACGTPVVATAVGGIPEQIEEGVTGCLVPLSNPTAMAKSIQKLLENEILRTEMSKKAANSAQQKFSLNRMVEDYLDLYLSLINDT